VAVHAAEVLRRHLGGGADDRQQRPFDLALDEAILGALGDRRGLTPNLDRLAREGLFFSRVYATGTRTVRGLEAISLSIPPTPGYSVVKRPNNEHLRTLGEVFDEKGYESLYVYGGYGYFDNMNHFFGSNGYTVVDRTAIPAADIHHENIWEIGRASCRERV